ncbi:MCE family protein [Mycolicibacterium thermoresistibile]
MKENLGGALWRLGIFVLVCILATFVTLMVFAELRFQNEGRYKAEFENVSLLENGDFVRIAGVEVGKVQKISVNPEAIAVVEFTADESVVLTKGTKVAVRYDNLLGDRYLELLEGDDDAERLAPGGVIPVAQTEPALDLDSLIGGFRPLFRALDPDQVNALTHQLIQAFQGQGATIGSFLDQAASFTSTLADRDQLIGQVISNLNVVLGTLGDETDQLDKTVGNLSELMAGLDARRTELSDGLARISTNSGILTDFVEEIRPPLPKVVREIDRLSGTILLDYDYVDYTLETLPETYQALNRHGIFGDFFSFYLCDIILKLNGKGGNPVYVKVAGQDTGRCTPK